MRKKHISRSEGLSHCTLLAISLISIYPFMLMLLGSFKTPEEFSRNPGGLPQDFSWENFTDLFAYNGGSIIRSYLNSILITTMYIFLALALAAAAAYGFAKFHFKGRDAIFTLLLATMILPQELLIAPVYLMMAKVNLLDTYTVQILPGVSNLFGMYLLRQNMLAIPDAVLESARIDGASEWKVFRGIAVPMSASAIGAFCILIGLGKWNDFMWPAFMVNSTERSPIMVILPMLSTGSQSVFSTPWTLILAGCVVATLPIFLLFLAFQDKIMSSVNMGAVKG